MPTKRKKYKIRDADRTRKRLLEVVGEIMKVTGHSGLTSSNIARHLGKDRKMVGYYFSNLKNLEKAYIREKDYWLPFFERFKLDGNPEEEQVRTMFTELMQENFRYFRDNPEMQKIILWQVSEVNPLTRSISDAREEEGAKLLALAEPYFIHTGVNFKAIIALLLGGSYYVLLHASMNKSTVAGVDANRERDRDELIRAIGKVIGWAWEAAKAGKEKK